MEDKNLKPSESDQQWLKELFDEASAVPQPEPAADVDFNPEDNQWLRELFASAEQAAELEITQQPPEETPQEPVPQAAENEPEQPVDPEIADILESILLAEQEEMETARKVPPEEAPREAEPAEAAAPEAVEGEDAREEADEPETAQTPTKRRPRNKNGYGLFGLPHLMVTAVWLAIILMVGGFLGQWIWKGASDVLAFGREEKVVSITIKEEDDLDSIIDKLYTAGLINEPMWFRWYAQLTDMMDEIGVGTYELNTLYDYRALVSHMSPYSSARVTVKVVIPEGYTCAQIFQLLEEKGVCSAQDLEMASMNGDFSDYWFLEGVQQDQKYCLEGYLFPDTYEFYISEDAERVLNTLLNNFDNRFTDIMMGKLEVLNETLADKMRQNGLSESYIREHQFTIREVVIIASLIEKESIGGSESYTISSVIYNRLTNPSEYPYLNIDASLVYITGNRNLTEEDKAFDSPYNTYLYAGLIPGPICNPSRVSLDAALDPSATEYYFYALNPATGSHHFSKTYAEHQAFLDSLPKQEEDAQ